MRRAVDGGVNHFDTTAFYPTYADGSHEEHDLSALSWANDAIRRALSPDPEDLVIATKVGPADGGLARPDQLRGQVEANLRTLGRDHLDLVYCVSTGSTRSPSISERSRSCGRPA